MGMMGLTNFDNMHYVSTNKLKCENMHIYFF
jgi:hypothetical protein